MRAPVAVALWCVLALAAAGARADGERPSPAPSPEDALQADAMGRRLQAELRAHGADVHGCYGTALAERAGLVGELLFRLVVEPGGAVSRAEVLQDQVGSGRLAACLTDAMRGWRMPRLAGDEPQQLVFPLAFRPDGPEAAAPSPVIASRAVKPVGGKVVARVLVAAPAQASLTLLTLPPSARLAMHQHPSSLELLYVLKGRAHLRVPGAAPTAAESGDLIAVPSGSAHSIEAAPLAPLELAQIFAPPGAEQAYLAPQSPAARALTRPFVDGPPSSQPQRLAPPGPRVVHAPSLRALPILGGKGAATLFLDGSGLPLALDRLEADSGAVVPPHQHDASDEILFVIAGRGTMTLDGHPYPVAAGDAIRIPMKIPHALTVTEKLVAVQCYAPAGPEQRFKAATERRP